MFTCKKCSREFSNVTKLVSHLTHPKSSCKCNIKEYYDTFLKKPNEGICIYCGGETAFGGVVQGYPCNKCKHCRNKGESTQKLRRKNFKKKREIKKAESGYYKLPEVCMICNERFKTLHGLAKHISQKHNDIIIKDYYDKYLKKPGEGVCPITGNKTNFKSLVDGYYIYFGKGTCSSDSEIQEQKKLTLLKNYGVTNPAKANEEQRIKNYKKTINERIALKEARIKLLNLLRYLSINKTDKLQCQICGLIFSNYGSVSSHITRGHKVPLKDYYKRFFAEEGEGICPISNLETNFDCLQRGFFKYHKSIITYTPEIKNASKEKQLQYIQQIISKEQSQYDVEIKDIASINTIGDLVTYRCTLCLSEYETRFTYLRNGFGRCKKCFPRNTHKSESEVELFDYINKTYQDTILQSYCEIIKNPNTGKKLELDIYLPKKKVAIEYDGLYWHSECILDNPEKYHLVKLVECNKKGITLFNIFEDEWRDKKDIVKNMVTYKLGIASCKKIHARKCLIKEIASPEKDHFLQKYHIQGDDTSSIRLGAFYNDSLISVMTFSKGKFSRKRKLKNCWELKRFAISNGYSIPGIASKLLTFFKRKYEWSMIYTFADLRWSEGDVYKKLGFNLTYRLFPTYWYVDNQGRRIHRFNLRKTPDEPKDVPEWMLRHEQGYYRIWDCGHLKFEMTNPNI